MLRNLDNIINNIQYHTSLQQPPKVNNILEMYKTKELSPRQNDMLKYHTSIISSSLTEKIISEYNK
jgi:hypothetical protein